MSALIRVWCSCSWHGEYRTQGYADYARRRHRCEAWEAKRARARARAERHAALDRTERPCTHKVARHEHGTYERYTLDHCHCDPCRDAKRAYETERRRRQAYGQDTGYVDATAATEHVRALMAAGMGWKRVAAAAGVAESTVYPLLYGRPDRNGGRPRSKARRSTVEAILAVPFPTLDDYAPGTLVSPVGTLRRVRALQSVGWPVGQIAAHAGVDRQVLDGIEQGRHRQITAEHARAVRDAFDRLWDVEPPQDDRHAKIAVARARNRAAERGWPMPLDLELIDVDDPNAPEPTRCTPQGRTPADLDEFLHLVRFGEPPTFAAKRLGVSLDAIEAAARRHGRRDVLAHLPSRRAAA